MRVRRQLAHPGFWMAVLLVLLAFVVQVVLSVPLGIIDVVFQNVLHQPSPNLEREPVLVGFINLVAFGAAIALGLYLNRLSLRCAFPIGRITTGQVIAVATIVLGMAVLLSEVDNVFRVLLKPPQWLANALKDLFFAKNKLFSRIVLLVIIAPITEETLFRGIILRGLLSRYRPAIAVALSAFLFGAIHANPWQLLSAFFLGLVFAWFYLRTGSLLLCVLAHAMANGLSLLCTLIPLNIPGLTGQPDYTATVFQPRWLDFTGLCILLAGLWFFCRATPNTETSPEPPPPPPMPFT
jgi:membrane protease YdiL (CAAX protease family)